MRKCLLASLILLGALSVQAITLEIWLTGHSTEQLRIIDEITVDHFTSETGIQVNYTTLSWGDFETRFLLGAASGETPDLGGMGGLFAPELGVRGAVLNLPGTFGDEFWAVARQLDPGPLRSLTFMGNVYALPYYKDIIRHFWRTDLLEAAGVENPNTWSELKGILPRLQARGHNFAFTYPIGFSTWWDASMFMWQHGADAYTPDGLASAWDSPQGIQAFTEYTEFYTKYKIPKEPMHLQMFRDETLAILQNGLHFYTNLLYAAPELKGRWDVGVVPGTPQADGRINHTSTSAAASLAIFTNSPHQREAWELLKFLVDKETQKLLSRRIMAELPGSILVPTHLEAWEAMPIDETHRAQIFSEKANDMSPAYALVAPMNRRRYLTFAVSRVVDEGMEPARAIGIAAGELNAELKRKQVEFARFIQRLR